MCLQAALLGNVPSAFRFSQYEPPGHSYSPMLAAYISPLQTHKHQSTDTEGFVARTTPGTYL